MVWIWVGIFVLMVIIEAETYQMVSVWFALGAVGAVIANLAGAHMVVQVFVFLGVAGITIATLRPVVKKRIEPKIVKSGLELLEGKTAVALEDITSTSGAVTVEGKEWNARSIDGTIKKGSECIVQTVESTTLSVKKKVMEEN